LSQTQTATGLTIFHLKIFMTTFGLKEENKLLRQQLQSLMDEARLNENKWRRLNQLEKQLIATRTLPDLIQAILQSYKSAYEIDVVTIVLADPEYEITRTLEREKQGSSAVPGLVILEQLSSNSTQPYMGPLNTENTRAIFDPWPSGCQSMALLPLIQRGELIGSLNMASCDAHRFTTDSSSDFLERLAVVFSICLENTLNNERLKLVGLTDHLTGVFNRRYFDTRCNEEVANARRHHRPLACMFLDIDRFKLINDDHGHLTGDEVLRTVASLIQSQLRNIDVIARYGGEEFVVLLPRTALLQACDIAERIRATIAGHLIKAAQEKRLKVTISIGIAMLPEKLTEDDAVTSQKLLDSADGALYRAKENGRNRVVYEERKTLPENII
jgi:diguanylate cyclase (GGDEF)-like protein